MTLKCLLKSSRSSIFIKKKKTTVAFEFTDFPIYWHKIVYYILKPFKPLQRLQLYFFSVTNNCLYVCLLPVFHEWPCQRYVYFISLFKELVLYFFDLLYCIFVFYFVSMFPPCDSLPFTFFVSIICWSFLKFLFVFQVLNIYNVNM